VTTQRSLTVLGCDGSYPGPGGAGSGYLVRSGQTTVLLDAGPGTFSNLQVLGDPGALDAVVLSHEHPDHWTDLESLAVWLHHGPPRPGPARAPLPVLAPPGLRRRSYFSQDPVFDWREVEPEGAQQVGDLALRFSATDHGPPTLAVRFDADLPATRAGGGAPGGGPAAALAYSADSGPDWTVAALGAGLGTVLCEATYTRGSEGSLRHLSGRQAGVMAADAGVGRLVLTHRWPTVSADELGAEAGEAFGRPVEQAAVGRVFEW
jgi:ribonuclease BN (tRNA processing enzyme)